MKKLILTIAVVLVSLFSKAQPTISSVNPLKARIDSLVTITGTNYVAHLDSNIVYFGPVKAEVVFASTTQLKVKVPLGAGYQPISVTTRGLTSFSNFPSSVLFAGSSTLNSSSFNSKIDSNVNNPYCVVACDFDIDGKPDVAISNSSSNTITIFKNNSTNEALILGSRFLINNNYVVADIQVADINGDGKKDLITTDNNNSTLAIYINTSVLGTISFAAKQFITLTSSVNPTYLNINDIDGDGKPDIVVTNYPNSGFAILRNTSTSSTISFATRLDFATIGTYPTAIEIADIDNDGKKDIIIGNSQNYSISIFKNNSNIGAINLLSSIEYPVSLGVHYIAVADLNSDGKLDIVTADYRAAAGGAFTDKITVLRNNYSNVLNSNSFELVNYVTAASGSRVVKLSDLDGDGKTDIIVGNTNTNLVSLIRNISTNGGSIVLANKVDVITGNAATGVEPVDLNLDGKMDIIVCNLNANTVSFLVNKIGNLPPVITNINPPKAYIDSTVTITGENFGSQINKNVVYFGPVKAQILTASTTQLTVKVPIAAGHQPISVTTGGLTATSNLPFNVLFPAQGILSTGSFPTKIDSITSNTPYRIITTDFDGDGRPDVIFGHASTAAVLGFTIYRNTSAQNTFSLAAKQVFNTGSINARIYTADIDGDGKKDLIMPNTYNQSFSVYRNTSTIGNISFAPRVNFLTASGTEAIFANINDIDGDGKLDIVTTNYPINGFQIFRNLSSVGNINFDLPIDYSSQGTYPTDIAIGDLNNDGKKDVVISNSQNYTVSVFQNVSTINNIILATPRNYAITLGIHSVNIADLNNDGKLDIIAADFAVPGAISYATTITVLQNIMLNGASFNANSFNAKVAYTVGSGSSDLKVSDFNGDGKTDVLVGNFQSSFFSILANNTPENSNIAFSSTINISTGSQAAFVESSDLNLDGKPDIIASNYGSNTISFLLNNMTVLSNENLISFTAQSQEKNALLKWQLNDANLASMVKLQYSKNGINWEDVFTAKLVSSKEEFVHKDLSENLNYYRLVQTTKQGKLLYSDVKVLNNTRSLQSNLSIYPNPANESIVVSSKNAIKEIVITDIQGKQMAIFECNNVTSYFISTLSYKKGIYFVKALTTKGTIGVSKLLVY